MTLHPKKITGMSMIASALMAALVMAAICFLGCEEAKESCDSDPSLCGSLQVTIQTPSDTVAVVVKLYRGLDRRGTLVEENTLTAPFGEDRQTMFHDLLADDYFVEAEGLDAEDTVLYMGAGAVTVEPEVTNDLTICTNSGVCRGGETPNAAPRIESVEASASWLSEGDAGMVFPPTGGLQYFLFQATVTDLDEDPVTIVWTVKNGPKQSDLDVGVLSDEIGADVTWHHDQPGTYWVSLVAMDGLGGAATFQFKVTLQDN
jgi:hypothetical protein